MDKAALASLIEALIQASVQLSAQFLISTLTHITEVHLNNAKNAPAAPAS